jgi:hypothetical protein
MKVNSTNAYTRITNDEIGLQILIAYYAIYLFSSNVLKLRCALYSSEYFTVLLTKASVKRKWVYDLL